RPAEGETKAAQPPEDRHRVRLDLEGMFQEGDRLGPLVPLFERLGDAVIDGRVDVPALLDGAGVEGDEGLRRVLTGERVEPGAVLPGHGRRTPGVLVL